MKVEFPAQEHLRERGEQPLRLPRRMLAWLRCVHALAQRQHAVCSEDGASQFRTVFAGGRVLQGLLATLPGSPVLRAETIVASDQAFDFKCLDRSQWVVVLDGGFWEIGDDRARREPHLRDWVAVLERQLEDCPVDETGCPSAALCSLAAAFGIRWIRPGTAFVRHAHQLHRILLRRGTAAKTITARASGACRAGFVVDGACMSWSKLQERRAAADAARVAERWLLIERLRGDSDGPGVRGAGSPAPIGALAA